MHNRGFSGISHYAVKSFTGNDLRIFLSYAFYARYASLRNLTLLGPYRSWALLQKRPLPGPSIFFDPGQFLSVHFIDKLQASQNVIACFSLPMFLGLPQNE